ncbi:predicted protein [Uncinocarpus reesii 1704]|uniref:Uncharacterized protein n=1 Tax=Uncinocarpus reesii (strain UAMH 1704) TaxID=336963 RepID=C4JMF5_UNCRE|nr:uncharacterized protein UREG_04013 [Uncinocarpus reesii 1704]EEP79167.1 predicted protein [Uncinocarpus reesii 1704]
MGKLHRPRRLEMPRSNRHVNLWAYPVAVNSRERGAAQGPTIAASAGDKPRAKSFLTSPKVRCSRWLCGDPKLGVRSAMDNGQHSEQLVIGSNRVSAMRATPANEPARTAQAGGQQLQTQCRDPCPGTDFLKAWLQSEKCGGGFALQVDACEKDALLAFLQRISAVSMNLASKLRPVVAFYPAAVRGLLFEVAGG